MALGRLREAVADVTETLRRLFQDPPVQEGSLTLEVPGHGETSLLHAQGCGLALVPEVRVSLDEALLAARSCDPDVRVATRLTEERGWETWTTGATVAVMEVFQGRVTGPRGIPPLPRRPPVRPAAPERVLATGRRMDPRLPEATTRREPVELGRPRVHGGLAWVEQLPVAIPGTAWAALPKPLQMRYSLELVKGTGENIRNVEVLGLFTIPDQGVLEMRHDPRSQRLLLKLSGAARGARRRPFLLAKRRTDGALVSCFLEQG